MSAEDVVPDQPESKESVPEDLDEILAGLLTELQETGETDSRRLDEIAARYPQLAEELRALWYTACLADEAATGIDVEDGGAVRGTLPDRIGDYEIIEEIGRGGMGVVMKARQRSLDRIVAIKMMLRGAFASDEEVSRLRTEAESVARLNHPNIVQVHEVGDVDGQPFFTMTYIDGVTLSERLADGPLPAHEAASLLLPIVRAIAEAHRHGILHRDLKSANILIDRDGMPFVTDFGLAKRVPARFTESERTRIESLTHSGAVLGTPGYMPPEQAAGRAADVGVRSDVYSLGAILYAMLTGRAPFQGTSPVDTLLMVLEQDPVPPRTLSSGIDPDLEMVALKCLQKPLDLRYEDADALAADLQAWLNDEPVSAKSSHFTQVLSRAFRETHHAVVLENWGVLWMWHSLVLFGLCLTTNGLHLSGVTSRWPYLLLWVVGLSVWAGTFWSLRRRSGPTTFVERQIAHVWAGSMVSSMLLFALEALMRRPVLELSPVLGVIAGMVFLVKAGILSGRFYLQSAVLFATSVGMAMIRRADLPDIGVAVFGLIAASCFFFPGFKYYRKRREAQRHLAGVEKSAKKAE